MTRGFVGGFLERHADILHSVKSELVAVDRIEGATVANFDVFFNNVDSLNKKNQYNPEFIWNFDESMVSWSEKRIQVITPRGMKTGIKSIKEPGFYIYYFDFLFLFFLFLFFLFFLSFLFFSFFSSSFFLFFSSTDFNCSISSGLVKILFCILICDLVCVFSLYLLLFPLCNDCYLLVVD